MNLDEALGELVRKYGAPVIGEERLAGLLSDLGTLDDPEMRKAAEAFSAGWYGKELLRLTERAKGDLPAIWDGIAEAMSANHGADAGAARRFAVSAAEAVRRAGSPSAAAPSHRADTDVSGSPVRLPGGSPQQPVLFEHSWSDAELLEKCRKAAAEGDAEAQRFMGEAFRYGRGVEQDYQEALGWFLKSALQGNASAEAQLGDMHLFGLGTEKNNDEAFSWYLKAAEHGNAEAQNNVAFLFINGLGTEKDDAKAAEWYRKAAEQGLAPAERNLGDM